MEKNVNADFAPYWFWNIRKILSQPAPQKEMASFQFSNISGNLLT